MTDSYTIRLSWPARALWQNYKCHWTVEHNAKTNARREAWALALKYKLPASPDARLEFTFAPPDKRRRDLHNMPATMKAAIDGIAQAMGVDDQHFDCVWPREWGVPVKGGAVFVKITPVTVLVPHRGQING